MRQRLVLKKPDHEESVLHDMDGDRIKIAYLIETAGRAGAETALVNLVGHLDRERYLPVAATGGPGWLADELRALGADVHYLPSTEGTRFSIRTLATIVRFLRDQRPHVVHTFLFQMNLYGAIAARLLRIPMIAAVCSKHYELAKWRRIMGWRLIARLSSVVTVNFCDLGDAFCRYARPPAADKVVVIPNGVDAQRFAHPRPRSAVRQGLGIPDSAPVIGTVGRTDPVEGQHFLIEAMAAIAASFPHARLVVVGAKVAPEFADLRRTAVIFGVDDRVVFTGTREDVPDLLAAMDVFVLPSLSEGMSNALLEAMAAGLPIVATTVGGNAEVIGEDGAGVLVKPGSPVELAQAICPLLHDPQAARAMGERARRRVVERYRLAQVASAYCSIYDRLARRNVDDSERIPASVSG
ncbi:MAG TPA: glycosyltransferase [Armatimonadota bacterium]|nr:glycosyltransferase [Armatimonadota bacterium]